MHDAHTTSPNSRRRPGSACPDRKRPYLSRQTARRAAWLMRLRYHTDQGAYRCRHAYCGRWHLTRSPNAERPCDQPDENGTV